MKKIFLIVALLFTAVFTFSQVVNTVIVRNVKMNPGVHTVSIPLTDVANTANTVKLYNVWVDYTAHKDTTKHSYMRIEESGTDGTGTTNWLPYSNMPVDSIKHIGSYAASFEEVVGFCAVKLRLYVFVGAGDTLTATVFKNLIK